MRVQNAIAILKGEAGLDENGVHLIKDAVSIHQVREGQQKNLACLQGRPGQNMYTIIKHGVKNGVSILSYKTSCGSNSLEGFHNFLPSRIPGPGCAAVPFQVYLLSGIARWNSDRESSAVVGRRGRTNRAYASPLIHRLNERCETLFGEVEEINFRRQQGQTQQVGPEIDRLNQEYEEALYRRNQLEYAIEGIKRETSINNANNTSNGGDTTSRKRKVDAANSK